MTTSDLTGALRRAKDLLEARRYDLAMQQVDIVLNATPTNIQALDLRSEILLENAIDDLNEGKTARAEKLIRLLLKANPKHVRGLRLLAQIAINLEVLDDAELLLNSAGSLEPNCPFVKRDLCSVLLKRRKFEEALEIVDSLIADEPDIAEHKVLRGTILARKGDFDGAIKTYRDFLAIENENPRVNLNLGHALKTVGHQKDAVDAYRKAIESAPHLGEPWWSLANLKTYQFDERDLLELQRAEAAGRGSFSDHYHRCFALGKAFADRGEVADAISYYLIGNAAKQKEIQYSAIENARMIDKMIEVCTPGLFESCEATGAADSSPIFIVGLPRSGSTLLEQILSSHSQVEGTMELTDVISIARALSGKRYRSDPSHYPAILAELGGEKRKELGRQYIEATQIHRSGAPYFTDKMPNNFAHIGLIRMILPNAKIIDARRHPLDSCFSGFRQLFANGQEFTYSLSDIGSYYRDYLRLMDHYETVLPGFILRMQYEDVVSDVETQVRRLLEFCGLPFEQSCLEFFNTKRAIRTASSEQVRQPIYQSGIGQWKPFEPYLGELKMALGDQVLERFSPNVSADAL